MAGRRTSLMDIRTVVRYLRATPNLSAIGRATGLNRRTIRRYQRWARAQGLLGLAQPLPPGVVDVAMALQAACDLDALEGTILRCGEPDHGVSFAQPARKQYVDTAAASGPALGAQSKHFLRGTALYITLC